MPGIFEDLSLLSNETFGCVLHLSFIWRCLGPGIFSRLTQVVRFEGLGAFAFVYPECKGKMPELIVAWGLSLHPRMSLNSAIRISCWDSCSLCFSLLLLPLADVCGIEKLAAVDFSFSLFSWEPSCLEFTGISALHPIIKGGKELPLLLIFQEQVKYILSWIKHSKP